MMAVFSYQKISSKWDDYSRCVRTLRYKSFDYTFVAAQKMPWIHSKNCKEILEIMTDTNKGAHVRNIAPHQRKITLCLMALLLFTSGAVSADLLGSVLKLGGISLVVSKFGPDINKGLNKLTGIRPSDVYATKVVPIISVGSGTSVGAVQVAGPIDAVNKTQAVAQIEGKILGVRIRSLIPVSSKTVTNIKRVDGVGVSGIIDIKI